MSDVRLYNMCLIEDRRTNRVVALDKIHSPFAGITLPGGRIEEGEGVIASVVREVREETGLFVSDVRQSGIVDWINPQTGARWLLFLTRTAVYSGELIGETHEGRVFWTDIDTFPTLPLSPNMDTFWRMYRNPEPAEALGLWQDEGLSRDFRFF